MWLQVERSNKEEISCGSRASTPSELGSRGADLKNSYARVSLLFIASTPGQGLNTRTVITRRCCFQCALESLRDFNT